MDPGFYFEVLWSDADFLEVRITASNGSFAGVIQVYMPIGGLKNAAESLAGFPGNSADRRNLCFGKFGPQAAAGAIQMIFHCSDSAGHAIIEANLESDYDSRGKAQSVGLSAAVEPAAIDNFVEELKRLEAERNGSAFLAIGRY